MSAPTIELNRTRSEQTHESALASHHRAELAIIAADLREVHLEAAEATAELDLDQTSGWARADAVIAEVAEEAYCVAALITGQTAGGVATRMRPVARLRELATAQAGLLAALDRPIEVPTAAGTVAAEASRSVQKVRVLTGQLQLLAEEIGQTAVA
jgi:hypothetical protein